MRHIFLGVWVGFERVFHTEFFFETEFLGSRVRGGGYIVYYFSFFLFVLRFSISLLSGIHLSYCDIT